MQAETGIKRTRFPSEINIGVLMNIYIWFLMVEAKQSHPPIQTHLQVSTLYSTVSLPVLQILGLKSIYTSSPFSGVHSPFVSR